MYTNRSADIYKISPKLIKIAAENLKHWHSTEKLTSNCSTEHDIFPDKTAFISSNS